MYIPRSLSGELIKAADTRPSLILTGARQVGKTTLLKKTFPNAEYVTFDNMLLAASAQETPKAFLERFSGQVILDEVQYVPAVFPALKELIDEDRDSVGKWILTGSQRFPLMKGISESLAGRIAVLHLESLSTAELRESRFPAIELITHALFRGGFPELWKNQDIDPNAWFEDYARTYIERDLRDLVQVKNLLDFRRFLGLAAARAGELINFSDLARGVGVSNNTIKTWIAALETSGIIYLLPPYHSNFEKRLIKAPKLYFADCGLLAALLNLKAGDDISLTPFAGPLWENFTFTELVKSGAGVPGRTLFFYRDTAGSEVDFLITRPMGPVFIEAKYTQRVRSDRLNFEYAALLFPKTEIRKRVAAPIGETRPLPMDGYDIYDPRLS